MKDRTTSVPAKKETMPMRGTWNFLEEMRSEMEDFWKRAILPIRMPREMKDWMPSTDVFRKNGELIVRADLPGMKKEEIEIALEDGDLVLRGERKHEERLEEENFLRHERTYGSFFRRVPLPYEVEVSKINAKFDNGVLEVHVPMPPETTPASQRITIA